MDEQTLKPCPFGGQEPKLYERFDEYGRANGWTIEGFGFENEDHSKEHLIWWWNQRPVEDALHARVAAKEQIIADMGAHLGELRARVAELEQIVNDLAWSRSDANVNNARRIAELEAALREIRDLPERTTRFETTQYEVDFADGWNRALEDVRAIVKRVLGES